MTIGLCRFRRGPIATAIASAVMPGVAGCDDMIIIRGVRSSGIIRRTGSDEFITTWQCPQVCDNLRREVKFLDVVPATEYDHDEVVLRDTRTARASPMRSATSHSRRLSFGALGGSRNRDTVDKGLAPSGDHRVGSPTPLLLFAASSSAHGTASGSPLGGRVPPHRLAPACGYICGCPQARALSNHRPTQVPFCCYCILCVSSAWGWGGDICPAAHHHRDARAHAENKRSSKYDHVLATTRARPYATQAPPLTSRDLLCAAPVLLCIWRHQCIPDAASDDDGEEYARVRHAQNAQSDVRISSSHRIVRQVPRRRVLRIPREAQRRRPAVPASQTDGRVLWWEREPTEGNWERKCLITCSVSVEFLLV